MLNNNKLQAEDTPIIWNVNLSPEKKKKKIPRNAKKINIGEKGIR